MPDARVNFVGYPMEMEVFGMRVDLRSQVEPETSAGPPCGGGVFGKLSSIEGQCAVSLLWD